MQDESTLRFESGRNAPWIDTGLELLVVDEHGRESTWPICRISMAIGSARSGRPVDIILDDPRVAERQAVLQWRKPKVMFLNLAEAQPATKQGKAVGLCELAPGEEIVVCGHHLRVVPRQPAAACLVGYSPPFRGRRWLLHSGPHAVGRPGKRENQILIDDRTVSRAHATITENAGAYSLLVETDSTPTFLNGHPVSGAADLKDGDLLQFGGQIVRLQVGAPDGALATRHATVLYADISNCQDLLGSRPLDEMVRQMGDYYEMVDRVVGECQGKLTTYLGDSVVAIFEAERGAVEAAVKICQHTDQMNALWRQVDLAELQIGVGIHTGEIVMGDLSLGARSDFAAVGEQANLAARIERQTRRKGQRILLSEATARGLGQDFELQSLGSVELGEARMELFAPVVQATRSSGS